MAKSFETAVEEVKILKVRPGSGELTELYGLYKQAIAGDVTSDRPGFMDFAGRTKWDAWNSKKGLSQEDAKAAYIDLVEKLKEKYGI